MKNKNVLVTGAGGFIGSHLCEKLVQLHANVTAFLRYTSRKTDGLLAFIPNKNRDKINKLFGDLRDHNIVEEAVKNMDLVFHLGALIGIPYSYINYEEVIDVNIVGTFNILNACNKYNVPFIHTSSSEVYGTALEVPITEKHIKQPQSPYSATKIGADALIKSFVNSFGTQVIIARPFNVYGPRQSGRSVIPTIIAQALYKNELSLGHLQSSRDFTYVLDTVDAFIELSKLFGKGIYNGEEFNISTGKDITVESLAKKILHKLNMDKPIIQKIQRIRPKQSEVRCLVGCSSKLKKISCWEPHISLDKGLDTVITFIENNPNWINYMEYEI